KRPDLLEPVEAVEHLSHGRLPESRQQIEHCLRRRSAVAEIERTESALQALDLQQGLALETRVGEVQAVAEARHRQPVGAGRSPLGQLVDLRALGVGKTEALADLVEDLADGVIARLAQGRDLAILHREERGVAAREHQAYEAAG